MASLSLDTPVADGNTVTAQTLHDLIENATVSGLSGGDLSAQSQVIVTKATAPDPADFPVWYDSAYRRRVLRFWHSGASCWITVGPDRLEIPLRNDSGGTLRRGAQVVAAGASAMTIDTRPSINALGFTQDTAASGAYVGVAYVGIGYISAVTNASATGNQLKGYLVHNFGSLPGDVSYNVPGNSTSGPDRVYYGISIDRLNGGGDYDHADGFRAMIRGPKVKGSF